MQNSHIYEGLKACTQHVWKCLSTLPDFLHLSAIIHLPPGIHLPVPENSAHYLSQYQSVECVRLTLADLFTTDAGKELINFLEQDKVIARHLGTPVWIAGQPISMTALDYIVNWVAKFIYDYQAIGYSDSLFTEFYNLTEEEFRKDTISFKHVYGVCCLNTDDEEISIDSDLYIKRISWKERRMTESIIGFLAGTATHTINSVCELPKNFGSQPHTPAQLQPLIDAREKINEFCSALRLFKPGHIGIVYMGQEYPAWVPAMSASTFGMPPSSVPGLSYS